MTRGHDLEPYLDDSTPIPPKVVTDSTEQGSSVVFQAVNNENYESSLSSACYEEGTLSIREYTTQIKEICDVLTTTGNPVSEVEQIATVLNGLPLEFEPFVAAIMLRTKEPYVLASQAKQVYYVKNIKDLNCQVAVKTKQRDLYDLPCEDFREESCQENEEVGFIFQEFNVGNEDDDVVSLDRPQLGSTHIERSLVNLDVIIGVEDEGDESDRDEFTSINNEDDELESISDVDAYNEDLWHVMLEKNRAKKNEELGFKFQEFNVGNDDDDDDVVSLDRPQLGSTHIERSLVNLDVIIGAEDEGDESDHDEFTSINNEDDELESISDVDAYNDDN
ncbi:hypothetical protein GQ457_17G012700 [Hibiscus cannabinus]